MATSLMRNINGEPCVICGFPIFEIHRLIPGVMGGEYVDANAVSLCPDHHVAIHRAMRSRNLPALRYMLKGDVAFWDFCDDVLPLIVDVRTMTFHEKAAAYASVRSAVRAFRARGVARV